MIKFEGGRCPNCKVALVSAQGTKGFILETLKHVKECPALRPEERQIALEIGLALLDLFRR